MELLGIGPMELFFIILLALIVLGPRDMQKAGRSLGRWLNNLVKSDTWKLVRQASNKIRYLPNELMREAGLDEIRKTSELASQDVKKELRTDFEDPFKAWKEQQIKSIQPPDETGLANDRIDPPVSGSQGGE